MDIPVTMLTLLQRTDTVRRLIKRSENTHIMKGFMPEYMAAVCTGSEISAGRKCSQVTDLIILQTYTALGEAIVLINNFLLLFRRWQASPQSNKTSG